MKPNETNKQQPKASEVSGCELEQCSTPLDKETGLEHFCPCGSHLINAPIPPICAPENWTSEKDKSWFQKGFGITEAAVDQYFDERVFQDREALRVMMALTIQLLTRGDGDFGYWPCRSLSDDDLLEFTKALLTNRVSDQKQQGLLEELFTELSFVFRECSRLSKLRVQNPGSVWFFELGVLSDFLYAAGHDLNTVLEDLLGEEWANWILNKQSWSGSFQPANFHV